MTASEVRLRRGRGLRRRRRLEARPRPRTSRSRRRRRSLLNGVVRDGSGGGWPLYARVTGQRLRSFGSTTLFTDPVTGYYGIDPRRRGSPTRSRPRPSLPGYLPDQRVGPARRRRRPAVRRLVQNFLLTIDAVDLQRAGLRHRRPTGSPRALRRRRTSRRAGASSTTAAAPAGRSTTGGPVRPLRRQPDRRERPLRARGQRAATARPARTRSSITPAGRRLGRSRASRSASRRTSTAAPRARSPTWTSRRTAARPGRTCFHQNAPAPGPNTQSSTSPRSRRGSRTCARASTTTTRSPRCGGRSTTSSLGQTQLRRPAGRAPRRQRLRRQHRAWGSNGATVANCRSRAARRRRPSRRPTIPAQPDGLYILFSGQRAAAVHGLADALRAATSEPVTVVPNGDAAPRLPPRRRAARRGAAAALGPRRSGRDRRR